MTTLLQIKTSNSNRVVVNTTEYKSVGHALTARVAQRRKNDGLIWEIWNNGECVDSTEWYN